MKEKTNILILTDSMSGGGIERYITELMMGLHRKGNYRLVFGLVDQRSEMEREAAEFADVVLTIGRRWRFDMTPAFSIVWQCKKHRIDLIHSFGWISGLAGLFAAKMIRIPIINGSIQDDPSKLSIRNFISRWCMYRSDAIISNCMAGLLAYGVEKDNRSKVIVNGIDGHRFENIRPRRFGTPSICMVGNFSKLKDHTALIKAMPKLLNEFPELKLVLVGREKGTLRKNRLLVDQLGLTESVIFITNSSHPEPFIAGSDVGVLISPPREGLPNAIMEYMALFKPVVVTDCRGNREIVDNGKNGFLIPDNCSEDIADKITDLLHSPKLANQMGQNGYQKITKDFSLNKMIGTYTNLYDSLKSHYS